MARQSVIKPDEQGLFEVTAPSLSARSRLTVAGHVILHRHDDFPRRRNGRVIAVEIDYW